MEIIVAHEALLQHGFVTIAPDSTWIALESDMRRASQGRFTVFVRCWPDQQHF